MEFVSRLAPRDLADHPGGNPSMSQEKGSAEAAAEQLLAEERISVGEAARLLDCSPSAVIRAIRRGLRGPHGARERLEAIRALGRWQTSRQAIARFVARLSARPGDEAAPAVRPAAPLSRAHRAAEAALEAAGW